MAPYWQVTAAFIYTFMPPITKLPPEMIRYILQFIRRDTRTAANVAKVCKAWQLEGANLAWRNIMLKDLFDHVHIPARLAGFANHVERIYFETRDDILADPRIKSLNFIKLETIEIYGHNLSFADEDTLKALITPALRVFVVKHDDDDYTSLPLLNDDNVWLALLVRVAPQITALRFLYYQDVRPALLHDFLRRAINLEHFTIMDDDLQEMSYHDLVLILSSFKLESLRLPGLFRIDSMDVDTLFQYYGPDWSLPAMRKLERIAFGWGAGRAAARLLSIMPNLTSLLIDLNGEAGHWDDAQDLQVFAAIGRLTNLIRVDIGIEVVDDCRLTSSCLLELACLPNLKTLRICVNPANGLSATGAEWSTILVSLPKLEYLTLLCGDFDVIASEVEVDMINVALSRIALVNIPGMTLFVSME